MDTPFDAARTLIVDGSVTVNAPFTLAGGTFSAGQLVNPQNLILSSGVLNVTNSDLAISADGSMHDSPAGAVAVFRYFPAKQAVTAFGAPVIARLLVIVPPRSDRHDGFTGSVTSIKRMANQLNASVDVGSLTNSFAEGRANALHVTPTTRPPASRAPRAAARMVPP